MSKILVLHKNDRDGYMAAAIVKYKLLYVDHDNETEITFIPFENGEYIGYLSGPDKYENIYKAIDDSDIVYILGFIDLSYSNIMDEYKDKIVCISNDIRWLMDDKDNKGFRIIGLSTALLTWIYETVQTKVLKENQNVYDQDDINEIHLMKICEVPNIIKCTHMYAVGNLDGTVISFNYGYNILDIDQMVKDIDDDILTDGKISLSAISDGDIIKKYITQRNENIIEKSGIQCDLKYENDIRHTLIVGMDQESVMDFGKYTNKFDIIIVYSYSPVMDGFVYKICGKNYYNEYNDFIESLLINNCFQKMKFQDGSVGFFIPTTAEQQFLPKTDTTFDLATLLKFKSYFQ